MDNNQPENRWNQIDRYVSGEMVDDERDTFEERMREHAGLAQQVHLHRDIMSGMEFHFAQQLKEQLALSDIEKKKFDFGLVWKIAAAVLLVAGLGATAYYYLPRTADTQQLFAAHFEAYPNTLTQRVRSEPASQEAGLPAAMQYYEAGQYAQAVTQFDALLTADSVENPLAVVFYRGVSYLGSDQATQAIADFEEVTQQADTLLTEPATWYLGLSYLKAKQTAQARQIFIALRDQGGDYAKPAADLLEEIG